MRYAGKKIGICDHYCNKNPYQGHYFSWYSYLGNKFIKTMCLKCALREVWGYNYKQVTKYKKWREECSL